MDIKAMFPEIIGHGGDPSCSSTITRSTPTAAAAAATSMDTSHRPVPISSRQPFKPSSSIHCAGLVRGREDEKECDFDNVFGPVPSSTEVKSAINELRRLINDQTESDSDSLQSLVSPGDSKNLQKAGYERLHQAMKLFEKEPAIQNVVHSLSSDKAVWEAIVSNREIKGLQGTISSAEEEKGESSYELGLVLKRVLKWIIEYAKVKVVQLIDKFAYRVTEILQSENRILEFTDVVKENIIASLLVAVVILLIVVVDRGESSKHQDATPN